MTAYVDPMRRVIPSKRWPWPSACHLYADTLDELHALANRIGLILPWFQRRQDFPHYDLTAPKRRRALRAGAVETTPQHAVRFMRRARRRRHKQEKPQ